MKGFLYVFEDGTMKLGPKPTDDDIQSVEDGYLSIVNLKSKQEFIPGHGWEDLEVMETEEVDEVDFDEDEDY